MIEKIVNNRSLVVLLHLFLGILFVVPNFSKVFALVFLIVAVYVIYIRENKNEEALVFSSYLIGLEVFLRMTKGALAHEMGKYGVALFLILGLFFNRKTRQVPIIYILYMLSLFLGIVLTSVPEGESIRKAIIFNLSGPILVGIVAVYCYKREISYKNILTFLYFMLLPIISMVVYLYIRTPSVEELVFNTQSNFQASGGYGPNQVSTAIGLGILVLVIFRIQNIKLTFFLAFDILLVLYLIYRGLLTFSRGGMITALITIIFFTVYISKSKKNVSLFKYFFISAILLIGVWIYTSNITQGLINNRYIGQNAIGKQKDIVTGRGKILEMQLDNFYKYPFFGIGVGNGKYLRASQGGEVVASHNEISRLIEEHGMIGVFALLLLFFEPLLNMYYSTNYQRAFLISFFLLWFLTISHSAMRVAMPSFLYGLSLIKIKDYS